MMPRLWFALLLAAVCVIQTAVLPFLRLSGWIDLLLILTLVCALLAPVHDARLAGWAIGLVAGLCGIGAVGVHAVAFGLAAVLVTSLRTTINIYAWWGRWMVCLIGAATAEVLVRAHSLYWEGTAGGVRFLIGSVYAALAASLISAILTGIPGLSARQFRDARISRQEYYPR